MNRRQLCRAAIAAALVAPISWSAWANDFPKKQPIRLVLGFAPGGSLDTIARSLNSRLGEILGQSVVIENRPGAGGTLAAQHVATAAPSAPTWKVLHQIPT